MVTSESIKVLEKAMSESEDDRDIVIKKSDIDENGEYHIQQKTLVADHSLFSWTPAIKYAPYCTWLADSFLYLLYQIGQWPLLFFVKYVCLFFPLFFGWLFALKMKVNSRLFVFLVLLIVLFAIVGEPRSTIASTKAST